MPPEPSRAGPATAAAGDGLPPLSASPAEAVASPSESPAPGWPPAARTARRDGRPRVRALPARRGRGARPSDRPRGDHGSGPGRRSRDRSRPTIDGLRSDLTRARARLDRLGDLLADDPLVGAGQALPPTAGRHPWRRHRVAAAQHLFDAAEAGRGDRPTGSSRSRRPRPTDPATASALAQLVELMATSRDEALAIAGIAVAQARGRARHGPGGLAAPSRTPAMPWSSGSTRTARCSTRTSPLSARLPAILGWDSPRRYLVLTQNPAELRPTGGYTGSYGIIAFDQGPDHGADLPGHLPAGPALGLPVHQGADGAHELPPGPHAALAAGRRELVAGLPDERPGRHPPVRERVRRHAHRWRARDHDLHDRRAAQGHRPDHGPRVRRDDRDRARPPSRPSNSRACAKTRRTTARRSCRPSPTSCSRRSWACHPASGAELLGEADTFQSQRLLLAWFKDAADEAFVTRAGVGGEVRQDAGDFLYPVDSNVAPASKLNAIATRSLELDVEIDELGNARNTLDVTWQNPIDEPIGQAVPRAPDAGGPADPGDVLPRPDPGAQPGGVGVGRQLRAG